MMDIWARGTAKWLAESGSCSISCFITHMRWVQTHATFTCEVLKTSACRKSPGALSKSQVLSLYAVAPGNLHFSQAPRQCWCCRPIMGGAVLRTTKLSYFLLWCLYSRPADMEALLRYSPETNSHSAFHSSPLPRNHPCPPTSFSL